MIFRNGRILQFYSRPLVVDVESRLRRAGLGRSVVAHLRVLHDHLLSRRLLAFHPSFERIFRPGLKLKPLIRTGVNILPSPEIDAKRACSRSRHLVVARARRHVPARREQAVLRRRLESRIVDQIAVRLGLLCRNGLHQRNIVDPQLIGSLNGVEIDPVKIEYGVGARRVFKLDLAPLVRNIVYLLSRAVFVASVVLHPHELRNDFLPGGGGSLHPCSKRVLLAALQHDLEFSGCVNVRMRSEIDAQRALSGSRHLPVPGPRGNDPALRQASAQLESAVADQIPVDVNRQRQIGEWNAAGAGLQNDGVRSFRGRLRNGYGSFDDGASFGGKRCLSAPRDGNRVALRLREVDRHRLVPVINQGNPDRIRARLAHVQRIAPQRRTDRFAIQIPLVDRKLGSAHLLQRISELFRRKHLHLVSRRGDEDVRLRHSVGDNGRGCRLRSRRWGRGRGWRRRWRSSRRSRSTRSSGAAA